MRTLRAALLTLRGRSSSSDRCRPGGRSRGQSLVEFTLVIPLFLLLVSGMVDFGLGLYSNMTVINAAREGARLGVTSPGDTVAVEDRVRAMAGGLVAADLAVNTTCERKTGSAWSACTSPSWQAGDAVVVTVNYVYRVVWPLASGSQIPLSSSVRMRIE